MLRLVQLQSPSGRRVALVVEPKLRLLHGASSIVELAQSALDAGTSFTAHAQSLLGPDSLDYDDVYGGRSPWRLLPAVDHPGDAAHCLVSGTGLTHLGSAADRSAMHAVAAEQLTDSMKMFRWGLEAGRPAAGQIGIAPEWFYKGDGTILRAHGEALVVPDHAEDGGEEGEIAAAYLIGRDGTPVRLGFMIGNEFSDHVFEKRNYLNLAGSKIRTCAIGPELIVAPDFAAVPGRVVIERGDQVLWSKSIATGESEMVHSLRNIEHHHFKFAPHRRPGDVHVHYLGAHSLSFGAGVRLVHGDQMTVAFEGFGRPLSNSLHVETKLAAPVVVTVLP